MGPPSRPQTPCLLALMPSAPLERIRAQTLRSGGVARLCGSCSSVGEARSSELAGSRQRPPVVFTHNSVVPVALDLIVDVTLAITRLGQSRVDADNCSSANAGGSRTTAAHRGGATLSLSARPHRVAPLARAGFRIAGRMRRSRVSGTGRCVYPKGGGKVGTGRLVQELLPNRASRPAIEVVVGGRFRRMIWSPRARSNPCRWKWWWWCA